MLNENTDAKTSRKNEEIRWWLPAWTFCFFLALQTRMMSIFIPIWCAKRAEKETPEEMRLDVSIQAQAIQHHLYPFWVIVSPERIIQLEPIWKQKNFVIDKLQTTPTVKRRWSKERFMFRDGEWTENWTGNGYTITSQFFLHNSEENSF